MVEVLPRLRIATQRLPITLILRQAIELDQRQREIVGAFLRQEITHQCTAAARDDRWPRGGILLEVRDFMRIERIPDATRDHPSTVYWTRSRLVSRGTP